MEIKTLDQAGINFLINEEGIRLHPYLDSRGIATIGIGCTYYENGERVTMQDKPISKGRAIELFKHILVHYEQTVWSCTRDDINQSKFNALVSLCYNIGTTGFKDSTVLRLVNENPNNPKIVDAFKMWRRAGKDNNALLNRRLREAKLYFS